MVEYHRWSSSELFNWQMMTPDLFQMGHLYPCDMIYRDVKWRVKWCSSLTGNKRQRKHLDNECDECFQDTAI